MAVARGWRDLGTGNPCNRRLPREHPTSGHRREVCGFGGQAGTVDMIEDETVRFWGLSPAVLAWGLSPAVLSPAVLVGTVPCSSLSPAVLAVPCSSWSNTSGNRLRASAV